MQPYAGARIRLDNKGAIAKKCGPLCFSPAFFSQSVEQPLRLPAMNNNTAVSFSRSFRQIKSALRTLKHLLLFLSLVWVHPSLAQTIPTDPEVGCSVTATTVNGWFKSGNITLNGVVNPANSVAFPNLPNCSFYEWSYQMFLWLTSPKPPIYGSGGSHIFESSAFFDVSPPDANGQRTFIPHTNGMIPTFDILKRQVGPNRLPLVIDKLGRTFEIEPPPKQQPPLRIRSKAGQLIEVSKIQRLENGNKIFLDRAGKTIEPQLLTERPNKDFKLEQGKVAALPRIQRFMFDHVPIFLDASGNVVEVEQAQADGSVLIAQNGSPIYYGLAANEVFVYYRTMQGPTVPAGLLFPTRQAELNPIITFASNHGATFVDAEALAVEIKTSWIEAAGLPNLADYITMTADIPTYDRTNPNLWVRNGHKHAQLAMVGMHVVGSTEGHPEMIWATFEHIGNAPDDDYSYRNSVGNITAVPRDTSGSWLFCATGSTGPFNTPRNVLNGNDIAAASSSPVGPDNIIRRKAWGAASDVNPNFKTPPASNSEIISINNTVRALLVSGDVRRNYILTGGTWMIAGNFPFTTFNTTQVGTSKMNNATMETFVQGTSNHAAGTFNCFNCHGGKTTAVSHIFDDTKPLF